MHPALKHFTSFLDALTDLVDGVRGSLDINRPRFAAPGVGKKLKAGIRLIEVYLRRAPLHRLFRTVGFVALARPRCCEQKRYRGSVPLTLERMCSHMRQRRRAPLRRLSRTVGFVALARLRRCEQRRSRGLLVWWRWPGLALAHGAA